MLTAARAGTQHAKSWPGSCSVRPLASSAQIAGLLIPLVALVSWFFEPLALSFRPIELAALGIAVVLPALVLRAGRTSRFGGAILLAAYTIFVAVFYLSGDR